MFVWAMHEDRRYLTVNPCTKQLEDDKAVERADIEDGRVLTADELRVNVALSSTRVGDTRRRWGDEPMLKIPLPSEHS
jgi:hypothetical protein